MNNGIYLGVTKHRKPPKFLSFLPKRSVNKVVVARTGCGMCSSAKRQLSTLKGVNVNEEYWHK